MSTVISYTPASRPVPASFAPKLRSWRPAPASLTCATLKRRPLSVSSALPEMKQWPVFDVPPTALVHPISPAGRDELWGIRDEDQHVKMWFQVPGLSDEDLEVMVEEDVLVIKKRNGHDDSTLATTADAKAGSFQVSLLMTAGYDREKVKPELKDGVLEVTIGKASPRTRTVFAVTTKE